MQIVEAAPPPEPGDRSADAERGQRRQNFFFLRPSRPRCQGVTTCLRRTGPAPAHRRATGRKERGFRGEALEQALYLRGVKKTQKAPGTAGGFREGTGFWRMRFRRHPRRGSSSVGGEKRVAPFETIPCRGDENVAVIMAPQARPERVVSISSIMSCCVCFRHALPLRACERNSIASTRRSVSTDHHFLNCASVSLSSQHSYSCRRHPNLSAACMA